MATLIPSLALALCLVALGLLLRRDLPRLFGPQQRVRAEVVGHARRIHDGGECWAPIYRFATPQGETEVVDQIAVARPRPPVGAAVDLTYPQGRPDLARPPTPWVWLFVYGVLLYAAAICAGKLAGWL